MARGVQRCKNAMTHGVERCNDAMAAAMHLGTSPLANTVGFAPPHPPTSLHAFFLLMPLLLLMKQLGDLGSGTFRLFVFLPAFLLQFFDGLLIILQGIPCLFKRFVLDSPLPVGLCEVRVRGFQVLAFFFLHEWAYMR